MRLEALLQNLHNDTCDEVKDYPLDEGQHVVSQETARALANLAQFISAHGLTNAEFFRQDLFTAVATSLLKPSHPGWSKNMNAPKDPEGKPVEVMSSSLGGDSDVWRPAETMQNSSVETLWGNVNDTPTENLPVSQEISETAV